jgi:hypothetical protein
MLKSIHNTTKKQEHHMSIETAPSSRVDQETTVDPETIEEIDAITTDEREVSPIASRIQRASNRITGFLEARAVTKAHSEALSENSDRDEANQADAFASYEDNIAYSEDHDSAFKIDRRFDRTQEIKQRISAVGERGLAHLKAAGEVTLGVSIIAGEAIGQKAKSVSETAALGTLYGVDRVKDTAETAALSVMYKADAIKDTVSEFATEKIDSVKQSYEQSKDSVVGFLQEKRDAAVARKNARSAGRQERRDARESAKAEEAAALEQVRAERETEAAAEREAHVAELAERAEAARAQAQQNAEAAAARKQARREKITAGRDKASELWQTAQTKRRAIGGRAIGFIARARASGQAASEAWKQYGEQNQV